MQLDKTSGGLTSHSMYQIKRRSTGVAIPQRVPLLKQNRMLNLQSTRRNTLKRLLNSSLLLSVYCLPDGRRLFRIMWDLK
ncbi:hypothetical protein HanPI659440_Chr09g0338591 [Helianthus annuus]|nr:hypothetical protein HanPI659440_Chr09g0338591 [Helianthus annuus]